MTLTKNPAPWPFTCQGHPKWSSPWVQHRNSWRHWHISRQKYCMSRCWHQLNGPALLTYWGDGGRSLNITNTSEIVLGETLLLFSTQTGDDCWNVCWGLVGRTHLIGCGTIGLVCWVLLSFWWWRVSWLCALHVYSEGRGQSVSVAVA